MSANSAPPPLKHHWLNPLNKLVITFAVKKRHKYVVLKTGHRLDLEYHEDVNKVWIHTASAIDYAPCGWFDITSIEKLHWIEVTEK